MFFVGQNPIGFVEAEEVHIDAETTNKPSENSQYSWLDYVIDAYNVDIVVGENNVYYITETITAYFNVKKHGIYRYIPVLNKIYRTDGSTHEYLAKIGDVKVNCSYSKEYNNNNLSLKIGDPDSYLTGKKTYKISYSFEVGKDGLKGADEFYFNIIGTEWDTVIGNVSFNITMPSEFDAGKLGFAHGEIGDTNSDGISYTVNENKISGSYDGVLAKNEGLTIRLELPDGYFSHKAYSYKCVYFIIPILCALIVFLLWLKFGKDDKVVKTVEFFPPDNLNSVELAFKYRGRINHKDVSSMLVYLASKGYIKITDETPENRKASGFNNEKFITIEKLKEYDGQNVQEKDFMLGLFEEEDKITLDKIPKNFYQIVNDIIKDVSSKENREEIIKDNSHIFWTSIVLMLISSLLLVLFPTLDYYKYITFSSGLIMVAGLFLPFLFGAVFITVILKRETSYRTLFFVMIVVSFILGILPLSMISPIGAVLKHDVTYLIGFIVGIICDGVQLLCVLYIKKRTEKGNQILGKILGFKAFLETAEKDRLEALVKENPTYFYDILPYTYVLGVSEKWIDKFENIAIPPADWYVGDCFTSSTWLHSLNTTMTTSVSSITSTTRFSGGGSGSGGFGGGSSGGGGGGGGGSSW